MESRWYTAEDAATPLVISLIDYCCQQNALSEDHAVGLFLLCRESHKRYFCVAW